MKRRGFLGLAGAAFLLPLRGVADAIRECRRGRLAVRAHVRDLPCREPQPDDERRQQCGDEYDGEGRRHARSASREARWALATLMLN